MKLKGNLMAHFYEYLEFSSDEDRENQRCLRWH